MPVTCAETTGPMQQDHEEPAQHSVAGIDVAGVAGHVKSALEFLVGTVAQHAVCAVLAAAKIHCF